MAIKTLPRTLTIERVSAFNGLDVLVARDEGLFEAEGLDLRIATLAPSELPSTADGSPDAPVGSQGRLMDAGKSAMFQG